MAAGISSEAILDFPVKELAAGTGFGATMQNMTSGMSELKILP